MNKDATSKFTACDGIYLLSHSVGRMPTSTHKELNRLFLEPWETHTPDPWPVWLESIECFRGALSQLLNGNSNEFCPQSNISSGLCKILSGLPEKAGKKTLLMTENDFPSTGFAIQQAQSQGYSIKVIPADRDPQDLETWSEYLTDDVACALIAHVHFNTSRLIPVEGITRLCRERDSISIVDIAQSVGVVPIDLQQWQADVVLGSCVKWLCGGPGAGFMWVNKNIVHSLSPTDVGWFSHQNPFEFDIHHFEYSNDSNRFWGGTPSVAPYCIASNSIELVCSIGINTIREHNQRMINILTDNIDPAAIISPTHEQYRGGTLVVSFSEQQAAADKLNEINVHFDNRKTGFRLSPHIYNNNNEMEKVLESIKHFKGAAINKT